MPTVNNSDILLGQQCITHI